MIGRTVSNQNKGHLGPRKAVNSSKLAEVMASSTSLSARTLRAVAPRRGTEFLALLSFFGVHGGLEERKAEKLHREATNRNNHPTNKKKNEN